MKRYVLLCVAIAFVLATLTSSQAEQKKEWWNWRGPNFNGTAANDQQPPTSWSDTENVIWKAVVPGRGHSSPIVVADRVVLSSADKQSQTQFVICFDRASGRKLWATKINQGGFPAKIHVKNTHASPSVTTNGVLLFASFNNNESVQLAALDLNGKIAWRRTAGEYKPAKYKFGYGPSPVVYGNMVIVASDFESKGFLAAFDCETGNEVWRTSRPKFNSFSTPIVGRVAGRDQLLISGANLVCGYDPSNGKSLWEAAGTSNATCGTMVWSEDLVFASGGYPKKETIAVRGKDGQVVWRNGEKCYEQSMIFHDGYIYAINDGGIALCWRAVDGEEMWKSRLGGPVSSSPILAGGNVYATNERGTTFVFQATPQGFKSVARNQLGDEAFATPAFVGNRVFARVASSASGARVETLYCIGN